MAKQKSLMRGMLAGMAGGLVAAWMVNELVLGPNKRPGQGSGQMLEPPVTIDEEVVEEKTGQLTHYAFGVLTGGIYGGLAEYSGAVRSGFGTSYGGVLFSTAAPAFGLPPLASEAASSGQTSPFAAHVVYGITTELTRRIVRALL
jgi:putative membrane protein